MSIARRRWLGLPWLVLAACGGGTAGGGPVPLEQIGARTVRAVCTAQVRCGLFPDEASCTEARVVDLAQVQADVSAGKTRYDPAMEGACLDAIAATSCNASDAIGTPLPCTKALEGTLTDGAACLLGSECVSQNCNVGPACADVACCAGTCGAVVTENGDCSGGNTCAAGTFCSIDVCRQRGGPGAYCALGGDGCASGLTCIASSPVAGTCGDFAGEGQECSHRPCDALDDVCDSTSTCTRRLPIGADCTNEVSSCARYATCGPTGTCVAKSGPGAPCSENKDCLGSLTCGMDGACALPPAGFACP